MTAFGIEESKTKTFGPKFGVVCERAGMQIKKTLTTIIFAKKQSSARLVICINRTR